jgi:dienelactone hydrolase
MKTYRKLIMFCLFITPLVTSCGGKEKKFVAKPATTVISQELSYTVNGEVMKGFLALPEGEGPFPGVLVVHEWWGLNDYPKQRAIKFAEEGYAALALDLFGQGQVFEHPSEAKTFSAKAMANLAKTEQNFKVAIQSLQDHPKVNGSQLAAVGYCFGGAVVLEMARRNVAGLKVVASYHGDLTPLVKNPVENLKARILIFNGGKDPMVSATTIQSARSRLKAANVRYRFINYKDAKHGFTNPDATLKGEKFELPLAYDAKADKDSWEQTLKAFKMVLKI